MSKILRSGVIKFILCFFMVPSAVVAQNITETQWYFGNSPDAFVMDKNGRTPNIVDNQVTPFGTNGSTVISDQEKGNLLFYSDGEIIYDNTHQALPGLGAATLSADLTKIQPVVSCPFPDGTPQYYIFTNTGSAIEFTVVDASLPGNSTILQFPLGDVSGAINQPTGLNNPGELMKILESADGQRYWLVTQEATTLNFQVTEINSTGLGATTSYDVFPAALPRFQATALAIKTDTTGTYVAASPKNANRNTILLDFDPLTGALAFNQQVIGSGFDDSGTSVIYDTEWSNDGSKLYISRTGDDTNQGNIYQIDFADTVNANPPVTPILNNAYFRSYGLKRAIDGNIYHLYQRNSTAPFILGRINRPDSAAAIGVFYDSLVFTNNFNGTQFPEFAPAYMPTNFFTMSFTYLDSCVESATKFIALVDPLPNNYFWNFGDGTGSVGPAPIHTYDLASGYFVTLTAELNGTFQSVTLPVDILPGDSAVDLGNDTTICVDETLMLDAGDGISYLWSTGELTQTIEVDTAGTYWVEVTGPSGCTSFDDIVVTEYGVQRQVFNQWYFGEMAGLDFNSNPPAPLLDGMIFSEEGCATMSDDNGQLLFYTNGSTVWNKDHLVMANGQGIGGDSTAAQSSIILPFPDDNTMFYIFTTEEVYGDFTFNLKMSIVDMKKDTARGQVLVKNIPIIECSTERVTASGFGGTPWLLAHEYGNNNFRAYQINTNGVIGAIHSSAGEPHVFQSEPRATGYMKFSPAGDLVAVVVPGSPNYIDLLNFDLTTGQVSNSRLIDIEEAGEAYGLEFSGDGLKLYVTTTGVNSKLIQYDLDSINSQNPAADIQATKFDGYGATLPGYGALQRGPNGVIYLAIDGQTQIGSISSPGGNDLTASYQETNTDLGGRTSRLGLPNFTQQITAAPQQPGITTEVACAGQPTSFTAVGRDSSIETYSWDFGDTTGVVTDQNPQHTYLNPGTYIVTLSLANRCDTLLELRDTIQVFNIPLLPTVPTDTALCGGPVTLFAWDTDDPGLNYYWSSGDTTRAVTFTAPTIVDVAIINDDGCSSDTLTVFIGEDESFIDLGPDRLICQNDTLILDSNDPGPNYTWYRDGVVVGDQRTQLVASATPGDFLYAVEVINDFSGCIYRDTIQITVQGGPQAIQSNILTPDCGQANGSFTLDISTTGNYSYALSGPVTAGPLNFDGPGTTPAFTGLPAGTYTSTVTNTVTGCSTDEIVLLEDNAPFEMEAVGENACALTGDISVRFSNRIPARVEINVVNEAGNNVFSSTETLTRSTFTINDLDSGLYFVEVRDTNPPNCIQSDSVRLSVSNECYRTIFVPNAFSPNGNGANDEWFAFPNEFVDQFQVYVFNRWGDLVFYSNNKNFRWDGSFAGGEVPMGTYAYRMLFTSTLEPEKGTFEQYGSVTVVK